MSTRNKAAEEVSANNNGSTIIRETVLEDKSDNEEVISDEDEEDDEDIHYLIDSTLSHRNGHHSNMSSREAQIRINCTNEAESVTRKKRFTMIVRSICSILIYYLFSITLTFYNRYLFKTYNYPLSITLVHMVVKLLLACLVRFFLTVCYKSKRVHLDCKTYMTRLLPTSLTSSIDIGFSNWSLQYITVSLYTMSKSTVILFILFFSILLKLEKWRRSMVAIVICISLGLFLFTYELTEFNAFGFMLVMLAAFTSGLRWTLAQSITQKHELGLSNPIDMIYHVQPGMIVFLLPLAVYIEGWPTFVNGKQAEIFYTLMDNFVWVIGGSFLAFFLESSEYLVVTYTSSLTLSVSGVFKEICTLYLAIVWAHNKLNLMNAFGLILCLVGICFHVYFKARNEDDLNDEPSSAFIRRRVKLEKESNSEKRPKRLFGLGKNKVKSSSQAFETISLDSHRQPLLLNSNN